MLRKYDFSAVVSRDPAWTDTQVGTGLVTVADGLFLFIKRAGIAQAEDQVARVYKAITVIQKRKELAEESNQKENENKNNKELARICMQTQEPKDGTRMQCLKSGT